MQDDLSKAHLYFSHATDLRALAEADQNPRIKQQLLASAETYHGLYQHFLLRYADQKPEQASGKNSSAA
jgi:hypothetical protein